MKKKEIKRLVGINTIIWDLDWTVWSHDNLAALSKVCKLLNIPVTDELYKELMDWIDNYQTFFVHKKFTEDGMVECIEEYMPILQLLGVSARKFLTVWSNNMCISSLGADKVMAKLQEKGYAQVGLTDWFKKTQIKHLKKVECFEYLEEVYAADDSFFKPDLRGIARIFEKHNRMNCVIIGDSLSKDIKLANDCGIPSIWLNTRMIRNDSDIVVPTYYANDISEILEIL